MRSLRELYRIGRGPSSSHTMGPAKAAELFLQRSCGAARYEVALQGSLAATGRGHFTDKALKDVLGEKRTRIVWKADVNDEFHPNGMVFAAFGADGRKMLDWQVYSVGGGAICERNAAGESKGVYRFRNMNEIVANATRRGVPLWQLVEEAEGVSIWDYLKEVYGVMMSSVERGLSADGVLPGGLRVARAARAIFIKAKMQDESMRRTGLLVAYARAASEENAALGEIVTAPTCGSCGVMPSVLKYLRETLGSSEIEILHALAVAGLVGNVVKRNGSISGAEVGCQGEIGVACAMASAAASYLMGGSPRQCECAAEIGLEHFLGIHLGQFLGGVVIEVEGKANS